MRQASYYLGASARLTAEHLRQAAQALAARADDDHLEREEAWSMPYDSLAQPASSVRGSGLAPPSPLPVPLTRLLGRAYECAQLVALLRRPEVRLLFVSQQDMSRAQQLAEQSLASFREMNNLFFIVDPLGLLGLIRLEQGELEAARPLLEDCLASVKQMGGDG